LACKNPSPKSKLPKNIIAKNVDEYLSALPTDIKAMLSKLRKTIVSAAPKAEELITYHIPTYKFSNKPIIHFMAHEKYCSLIAVSKPILEKYKKELEGYHVSGSTIHFTVKYPLPASLVKKIVMARLKEKETMTKK
jgi:uncharacterized protein YdhG (YjbR/CyaY superfamily)